MVAAVLSLMHGVVPPTLNYEVADPHCPVNVIHGGSLPLEKTNLLLLSHAQFGQAIAVIVGAV